MAPAQSGLTGLLSISAMPDCPLPAEPSVREGPGSDPGPASWARLPIWEVGVSNGMMCEALVGLSP